jgi:hypothetical protein
VNPTTISSSRFTAALKGGDFLFILTILLVFVAAFWIARDWYLSARLFPWFAAIPGAVLCVVQLCRYVIGWEEAHQASAMAVDELYEPLESAQVERRRNLEFWVWLIATAAGIWLFGMTIAGPVFMALFARFIGQESWRFSFSLGVATFAFVWGLFVWGFDMAWPPGELFYLLDINIIE